MGANAKEKKSFVSRFLNGVEFVGNKLPDPAVLFFFMCVGLAIITWFVSLFNVSVKHPGDGKVIHIKSILSHDGFAYIMNNAIKNFSEFPAIVFYVFKFTCCKISYYISIMKVNRAKSY